MKKKIKIVILKLFTKIKYFQFLLYTYLCKKNKQVKYIMFNTPTHGNIGDHAIILGEEKIFSDLNLYIFKVPTLISEYLLELIKSKIDSNDIICITGGGFIGSIWMKEENLVNKVLTTFKDNKIVVMPQTVYFDESLKGKKELEKFKNNVNQCKNIIICVRENLSLEYVKKNITDKNIMFVPDVVLYFKNYFKFKNNKKGTLMCLRNDVEKSLSYEEIKYIEKYLNSKYSYLDYTDTVLNKNIILNNKYYFKRTLKRFSKYELIITDRLHGMIFAILTNTPCVVLGNFNHKVKGVYEFIKNREQVVFMNDVNDIDSCIQILCKKIKSNDLYDYKLLINELINRR